MKDVLAVLPLAVALLVSIWMWIQLAAIVGEMIS